MIGIDVSKDKLDVYISQTGKHQVINNKTAHINKFLNKLKDKQIESMIVFEPTGCYSKELEVCCLKLEMPYHKANLNKVYHFSKSTVGYAKTDKIDAAMLAAYAEKNDVSANEGNSVEQLQRQELANLINNLKTELAALKTKSQNIYLNGTVKKYIKKRIKSLDKEIVDLTKELDALIAKDEELVERYALLNTVKGVGENTARLLVTCLPELGSISREAIVALVGLAPYNCDSGKKVGYRSIKGGRFHVRNGLYMAALSASRYNPRMKKIYQSMLMNGKKPKQALVAIMRKMLIMMNAMVKNKTPWLAEI